MPSHLCADARLSNRSNGLRSGTQIERDCWWLRSEQPGDDRLDHTRARRGQ